jgi:predicted TIM-barrel enzyme
MNGGEFMVVLIVAMIVLGSIIRGNKFRRETGSDDGSGQENARLRDEVQQLKERIKVLERITVEKENSLAKEIESLRDR